MAVPETSHLDACVDPAGSRGRGAGRGAAPAHARDAAACASSPSACRLSRPAATSAERLAPHAGEGGAGEIAQGVDRLIERLQAESAARERTRGRLPAHARIDARGAAGRARRHPAREPALRRTVRRAEPGASWSAGASRTSCTRTMRNSSPNTCGATQSGQAAPQRLEVELQPEAPGPAHRLELTFARTSLRRPARRAGHRRRDVAAAPSPSRRRRSHANAWEALDSLAESVLTTDVEGRIVYINKAGEHLIGKPASEILGRTLGDVIELVDEGDRKALGDPVRQSIVTGARVSLGRRGMLVSADSNGERSIEVTVSPMRDAAGQVDGTVIALRDVTDLRGLDARDVVPGEPRRPDGPRQSARVRAAARGGARGDARRRAPRAVLPRPRPLQGRQRRVRPRRRRQHAARGRRADQGCGARLRHGRPARRRRVRHPARRLPAREGAADRRRRRARGQRPSLRLEGQDLHASASASASSR